MDLTVTAREIGLVEAAKLIRTHLKHAFPGVRFSVRTSRYAGGSSVSIAWTDGPTEPQVREITDPFAGRRFDGQIDGEYRARQWYCPAHGARVAELYGHGAGEDGPVESRCCARAELVEMQAGYVETTRRWSPAFTAELREAVAARYGMPFEEFAPVDGADMGTHVYRLAHHTAR